MRKLKNCTNRSAGLAVDNPPAVGLALVKAIMSGTLTARKISATMSTQSPVLKRDLVNTVVLSGATDRP